MHVRLSVKKVLEEQRTRHAAPTPPATPAPTPDDFPDELCDKGRFNSMQEGPHPDDPEPELI